MAIKQSVVVPNGGAWQRPHACARWAGASLFEPRKGPPPMKQVKTAGPDFLRSYNSLKNKVGMFDPGSSPAASLLQASIPLRQAIIALTLGFLPFLTSSC